jgi:hypothetical protein
MHMGGNMEQIIQQFKYCDSRFYPHIEKVLKRLPKEVTEKLRSDTGFQILAGDDLLVLCVVRYEFDKPVRRLINLNTKLLMEPEHRLIYTIAHEIARYVGGEGDAEVVEKKAEDQLIKWGFEQELEAYRYDTAIAESEGYQIGYEWAKKQSRDYVLRHFGLYFDEWNTKGLRKMSKEQFEVIHAQAETVIRDEAGTIPQKDDKEHKRAPAEGGLPRVEAIIAGIMTAVKEIKFHDLYGDVQCDVRPPFRT